VEYHSFYELAKTQTYSFASSDNGQYKMLGNYIFTINEEMQSHDRQVYGILDVLGDFGGV
jgi:hypothetical protein